MLLHYEPADLAELNDILQRVPDKDVQAISNEIESQLINSGNRLNKVVNNAMRVAVGKVAGSSGLTAPAYPEVVERSPERVAPRQSSFHTRQNKFTIQTKYNERVPVFTHKGPVSLDVLTPATPDTYYSGLHGVSCEDRIAVFKARNFDGVEIPPFMT
jgi:hypothetical protein